MPDPEATDARRPPPPSPGGAGFGRWPWWRRWFGRRSERAAARYVRRTLRLRLLAVNVADAGGELDILALDGATIVVVEVRSVSDPDPTRAAESVDFVKQKKLTETTLRFLARRRLLDHPVRFDVLAISWPPGQRPAFRYIRHAFEATGRFQFFS